MNPTCPDCRFLSARITNLESEKRHLVERVAEAVGDSCNWRTKYRELEAEVRRMLEQQGGGG